MSQVSMAIAWARGKVGSMAYKGRCQAFVADAYYAGAGMRPRRSAVNATTAGNQWIISRSRANIPAGACVYFTSPTDPKNGHVALYIGNNQVIHAFGSVRLMTIDAVIASRYGFRGWGWNGGVKPTGAGDAAGNSDYYDPYGDAEEDEPAVIHIPQTEKVYTKYEDDTPYKPVDLYAYSWQSAVSGLVKDISARVGSPSLSDDVDSICTTFSFSVLQATGEKFFKPLGIACGDLISVTNVNTKECIFTGQVQSVSGSYRDSMSITCHDNGRLLTCNDVILQFNNVPAKTALSYIAERVGIPAISCPNLISSVYSIEKDSAASIAKNILETVTAENGVGYFLRMMGSTLVVRSYAKDCIKGYHRQEANLSAFDIMKEAGDPQVSWSIDDLRNDIIVYSENDNSVSEQARVSDPASVKRYGRRVGLETFSDQDKISAGAKAKTSLARRNRVKEEFSLTVYGSDRICAGCRMAVDLPEIKGEFWVLAVTHDLGPPHMMNLTMGRAD